MKKSEIVDAISEKAGLTKSDASKAYDALVEVFTEELKKGNKISIVGFGTFAVSERAAREGRNPRTGETVQIAARRAVTFKPGAALKEAVN